jgi:hypothetical protein
MDEGNLSAPRGPGICYSQVETARKGELFFMMKGESVA